MSLQTLTIQQFRNLSTVTLAACAQVNHLVGENGSGKTSILEAVYCLGSTRSFRTRRWQSLIQHDAASFTVAGTLARGDRVDRLGVERQRGEARPRVKYRGDEVTTAGDLAGVLPVQVIDSAGFRLLEGPPEGRRQVLDWAVFHVEQQRFVSVWRRYRRALAQRNQLLRQGQPSAQSLAPWTEELVRSGDALHILRAAHFERLAPLIQATHAAINAGASAPIALTLDYDPGWDAAAESLADRLSRAETTDRNLGFTRFGPHRADLRVRVAGQPAADRLSRGQLKTVVCCLRIAQATLLQQYGIKSVFLVDDLAAELDPQRRQGLVDALLSLDTQLFFTSIQADDLAGCFDSLPADAVQRFHVKHGAVGALP